MSNLASIADLVLQTDHYNAVLLARTAAAWRGLGAGAQGHQKLVDVLVGGQYGSEGKGNVCAHIATRYNALVRIGGPNAGHRVAEPPYKYVQLPSGTGANPRAEILIGAGSTIWLPQLMKEIADHKLSGERLSIDPQAMIIEEADRDVESGGLQNISTTGQGVGAANARKILNRGKGNKTFGPPVRLARDVDALAPFLRKVRDRLGLLQENESTVLIEGTQGTMLSIHHGLYPHVTSRETSVAGCLADAGVAPMHVRNVIMVLRTYPIRVGGPSGWIGEEIGYETLSQRSKIPIDELKSTETGTVSGKQRRLAEFDWAQLGDAAAINGATEIAVTFADYFGIENRKAKCFDELNVEALSFIERVERVTGIPVSMVSKAFAADGVIERKPSQ
ncbi:MAG: adenylosuccinate synthetase [Alphaproteobacteria bacterium]